MKSHSEYSQEYWDDVATSARSSCRVIVPLLNGLIGVPRTVVDVGCGRGSWLREFQDRGAEIILGIDSPVLDGELDVPSTSFLSHDLTTPLHLEQRFDLAISLEVIEHLPQQYESSFVDSLTRLSDLVLFSAAIPGQGGLNHVNEQWQQHWVNLFRTRGFLPIDCLRSRIWDDPRVEWWYAQNILLFYAEANTQETIRELANRTEQKPFNLVHPDNYSRFSGRENCHAISRVPLSNERP